MVIFYSTQFLTCCLVQDVKTIFANSFCLFNVTNVSCYTCSCSDDLIYCHCVTVSMYCMNKRLNYHDA